jgi:hypothetical protein
LFRRTFRLPGFPGTASGHDTTQQQSRPEPGMKEDGIHAQRPEPPGRGDLLQPDNSLYFPIGNSDREVQRDGSRRDLLCFQVTGETDSGIVQGFCNTEHSPGFFLRWQTVYRGRNFPAENDHGSGSREKFHH